MSALIAASTKWCDRFPTSTALDDLAPSWAPKAKAFVESLRAGGAAVGVNATWRPAERAYLMHWCCMIGAGAQDPALVPAMAGVGIDWTCGGNLTIARAVAASMMRRYGIAFPAALVSRHTQRLAMDLGIVLPESPARTPKFKGGDGKSWLLSPNDLPALYRFGASFGVIKLVKDPPHWSSDGH